MDVGRHARAPSKARVPAGLERGPQVSAARLNLHLRVRLLGCRVEEKAPIACRLRRHHCLLRVFRLRCLPPEAAVPEKEMEMEEGVGVVSRAAVPLL